ncbi:hypothetical protein [Flavobacterium sp.]|uniref:hypothetical protein n=1 Tax=Flavobacterium sp. TaxID=239 RepID=UPI00333F5425
MKKLFALAIFCTLLSCSSDDSFTPTPPNTTIAFMDYRVDNTNKSTTSVSYIYSGTNTLKATGSQDGANNCVIFVNDSGTGSNIIQTIEIKHQALNYLPGTNFTTNISVNDAERIEGTFSGIFLKDSDPNIQISITNGFFRIMK